MCAPTRILPWELAVVSAALVEAVPPNGARVNVDAIRFRRLAIVALAPLALAACGSPANVVAAGSQCHEQIIVSFSPGFTRSDKLVKELSRSADARLEYLRSSSPTLHVFALTSPHNDPGCKKALAVLRADSRVRFAELDARRVPFSAAK